MSMWDLLAVDAGQTGIKLRLQRQDGTTRDDLLPGVLTDRPLLPQLADAAEHIVRATGEAPRTIAYGVSGVTDMHAEAFALLQQPGLAAVERVIVAHDSVTSFLGVLGDRFGAVLAAGTGVVTLGVGPERAVRIDGWGNIMGDAGSGYWIGRESLDAVMRAYDGRGAATSLRAVAEERWPDLEAAYRELQAAEDRVRLVASFARPTAEAAAAGDAVAIGICERAADELAHSVITALETSGAPADAPVGVTGGVLGSELIRSAFTARVRAARPEVHFVPPEGTGLDGALALASLAPTHPLRSRFTELTREPETAGDAR